MPSSATALSLLSSPYRALQPLEWNWKETRARLKAPGTALVWNLGRCDRKEDRRVVNDRPGGTALILILPPAARLKPNEKILHIIQTARPNGILPHHEVPHVDDLAQVLRRPPTDLAGDITEYLAWRGFRISREARQLVRKTVELSAELRSITALARSMYLSRRALGRRFDAEGLPVPSHWLHFCRLLRVALRLQNTEESVVTSGFRFGYTDGFSLSNQMYRMTGFRPSEARKYLGWEWFLEAWLRREAERGGLRPHGAAAALADEATPPDPPSLGKPGRRFSQARDAKRATG